ncbi:hypothetical protein F3Y22_tig00112699pilonHSYRG00035 [Hibiscus syriacus]|uniref:Cytochrome P450 86B1 n=1 Tax=Hibiscus syriacus TaxID=106335 RepID=A0A6A2X7H5_HIBSY|nr:hypothetical protein F3Y22_tig00112699pilonHSYRG00035 [Hibiscus syriacus]
MTTMGEMLKWAISRLTSWDLSIALLGLFIFRCLHQRRSGKGPMLWPVLGILPTILSNRSGIHDWGTRALIKTGGTFPYRGMWMGGAHGIITIDPSIVEYMLKTNFNNFPKGSCYKERFRDLLGDGIFNSDGESWKQQRQLAKVEMHSSPLGVDPGCLALDLPDIPFAKAFEEATELSLLRFLMPPFVLKPLTFFGLGTERRLKEAIEVVHNFADKTVRDRRNILGKLGNINDHSDLLSRLMESDIKHFPGNFLRDFCVSFILAGRDTTSVALAWFFWLIQKNPDEESKILAEIHQILGHSQCNNDIRAFTEEGLKKMVYLQAALSESLRLYPSVPVEMKQVQEDDVFPDGTRVKKGARIFHIIYSMGRIESIWGKDCLEFKPERWIKDGKFVSASQFKFPVFNAGPRLCLGKKFAYTQMKMVAASVLLRYSIKVVEGQSVVPKLTTTLYMKNGLMVTFKPRLMNNA